MCFYQKETSKCVEMGSSFILNDLKFDGILDTKYGAKIVSNWPFINTKDKSGIYTCRLTNKLGSVESAAIQISDSVGYKTSLIRSLAYEENGIVLQSNIEPKDLPIRFQCGTSQVVNAVLQDYNAQVDSPFYWFICATETSSAIHRSECRTAHTQISGTIKLLRDQFGTSIIQQDGTLWLMEMPQFNSPIYVNPLCMVSMDPEAVFNYFGSAREPNIDEQLKTITISPQGAPYSGRPRNMTSLDQRIVLRAGQYNSGYKLNAIYAASKEAGFKWTKDGNDINRGDFTKKRFTLQFPKSLTTDLEGVYSLSVDNGDLVFRFTVTIQSPPVISHDIAPVTYRMHNGVVKFVYRLSTGDCLKSFHINGYPLDLTNKERLAQSVAAISSGDNLKSLNVVISPLMDGGLSTAQEVSFAVNQLVFNSYDESGQSHVVTFTASNHVGTSRQSNVIKVVPYPVADKFPLESNCDTARCVSSKEQSFDCIFSKEKYINEGVAARIFWYFNNETLLDGVTPNQINLRNYFKLLRENSTVVLKSIGNDSMSNLEMKDLLRDATLTCRLLLAKSEAADLSIDLDTLLGSGLLLFDSFRSDFHDKMTAVIKYYEDPVVQSSLAWIIGLILGLLVLIILVAFLFWWFFLRHKTETYKVEATELKHGRNPREERKEDEFATYDHGSGYNPLLKSPTNGDAGSINGSVEASLNGDDELDQYGPGGTKPAAGPRLIRSGRNDHLV